MERRGIVISGTVQGVGFRPFVVSLASRLELGGFVRNQTGGVQIEVEGEPAPLEEFLDQLRRKAPPLAQIDALSWEPKPPRGESRFCIEPSESNSTGPIAVAPDVATCDQCLSELFDPRDRRFGYPFLNCTNCGPRLTIVTGAPYDRERTTMAGFPMCAACRAEYDDPANRRFHAQPTACAACGPRLQLLDADGRAAESGEALALFAAAVKCGKIGALKGLGGYHLACDAGNAQAVALLRRRKHRDEKPFAVMVRDLAAARVLCDVGPAEQELLVSPRRLIVLLRKRNAGGVAREVAPGNPFLGIMLPYTPLHHLLLREMGDAHLVMTSGNRSDEPIAFEEPDAIERLRGIADLFLVHNRPIHVRCDDSVTRVIGAAESPVRRSRGYAPQPIGLPMNCPSPILAVGGQLKGTFALGSDRRAILSHHLGDLDHLEAYRAFERDITLYERLFALKPVCIAHDLHPDYASTRYALRREAEDGIRRVPVQHHHAHMTSCMAEHGLAGPVLGVSFDGTGFGTDGAVWGGEFLVGDYHRFQRAAHLRYVGMPGGEQAIREPWRMAAAHLMDADSHCASFEGRIAAASLRTIRAMLARNLNAPQTSSAGRLFDAIASLVGVRDAVTYEGQAAMQLEWLAKAAEPDGAYPFDLEYNTDSHRLRSSLPSAPGEELCSPSPGTPGEGRGEGNWAGVARNPHPNPLPVYRERGQEAYRARAQEAIHEPIVVDTRPLIRAVAHDAETGVVASRIARRFHSWLVELICTVCSELRKTTGIDVVTLSGGVFMNALLTLEAADRLTADGFRVYRHAKTPPNDGGLSLGQLAVAASQLTPQK